MTQRTHHKPPTPAQTRPDLIIIPQFKTALIGTHLTDEQAAHVERDWHNYANADHTKIEHAWCVQIAHMKGTHLRITAEFAVPRSEPHTATAAA